MADYMPDQDDLAMLLEVRFLFSVQFKLVRVVLWSKEEISNYTLYYSLIYPLHPMMCRLPTSSIANKKGPDVMPFV